MDLVALKVKIGLRPNGHADHPAFNNIDSAIRKDMDWSHYVDQYGTGWHYDKSCGHKEHRVEANSDTDSPMGMQWGILMIPEDFADAAISKFPKECSILTEAQLQEWYDNRCHKHEPEEKLDLRVLEGIKAKRDAGIPLNQSDNDALNVDNDTPGITRNKNKRWIDFKANKGIKIVR